RLHAKQLIPFPISNLIGWKNERTWIIRLLRDGMKSETDWRLLKRRHTWSLLATLYQSSLDIPFRRLILQVSIRSI
ncbi:MAG: hypothetical protein EOO39_15550, partial [Cytophagaceae bacterium]